MAPVLSPWTEEEREGLARELELWQPTEMEERVELKLLLFRELDRPTPDLSKVFPNIYAAVAEDVALRAAIEECN